MFTLKLIRYITLIFITFFVIQFGKAYSRSSSGAGASTHIPIGARAEALGGAFVAVANDSSAFYHNPAGITIPSWSYLSLNAQRLPMDNYFGTVVFTHSPGPEGNWAFGIAGNFLYYKDIMKYDSTGNQLGKATNYSDSGYITIARKFGENENFRMGFNLKFINEKLDNVSAYGGGFDFGALLSVSFIDIGIMLQDIFTIEKFSNRSDSIYLDRFIKIGIATSISDNFKISLQVDKNLSSTADKVIFRMGSYFRLWAGKSNLDIKLDNLDNLDNIKEDLNKAFVKKEFREELYLNVGYGDNKLGFGITIKKWKMKFDLSTKFEELYFDKMTILFAMDIPLY
ncbi:MAG: UPF0164 family protein [Spirochaetota bacterium]|nr:UPF0164 family protein [Spirochaetota bacterium]